MEVNNARLDENADESPADAQKSEDHKKLLEYGIHESVADRLDEIYKSGKTVFRLHFYPLRFSIIPRYLIHLDTQYSNSYAQRNFARTVAIQYDIH